MNTKNNTTVVNIQIKPTYVPPQIISYSTTDLMRQLGPARACSGCPRDFEEELLFGGDS